MWVWPSSGALSLVMWTHGQPHLLGGGTKHQAPQTAVMVGCTLFSVKSLGKLCSWLPACWKPRWTEMRIFCGFFDTVTSSRQNQQPGSWRDCGVNNWIWKGYPSPLLPWLYPFFFCTGWHTVYMWMYETRITLIICICENSCSRSAKMAGSCLKTVCCSAVLVTVKLVMHWTSS